jgi:hypothetical protein
VPVRVRDESSKARWRNRPKRDHQERAQYARDPSAAPRDDNRGDRSFTISDALVVVQRSRPCGGASLQEAEKILSKLVAEMADGSLWIFVVLLPNRRPKKQTAATRRTLGWRNGRVARGERAY